MIIIKFVLHIIGIHSYNVYHYTTMLGENNYLKILITIRYNVDAYYIYN